MKYYGPRPLLTRLSDEDFPQSPVHVSFADGSVCRFRFAFYRREEGWLAVYSKNCGFHMFPLSAVATVKGAIRLD